MAMWFTIQMGTLQSKLLKSWLKREDVAINDEVNVAIYSESPVAESDLIFVYAHGGGYVCGDASLWRYWLGSLVRLIPGKKCAVVAIEYRMAPEYTADTGACVKDFLAADKWVRETCPKAKRIWAGDSAGGGLAVTSCIEARDQKDPLPEGLLPICPFIPCHLCACGEFDVFPEGAPEIMLNTYMGKAGKDHKYITPDQTKLQGLPPTMILTGTLDSVNHMAVDLHKNLGKCGVDAKIHVGENMPHEYVACEFVLFGVLGVDEATRQIAMNEVQKWVDGVVKANKAD